MLMAPPSTSSSCLQKNELIIVQILVVFLLRLSLISVKREGFFCSSWNKIIRCYQTHFCHSRKLIMAPVRGFHHVSHKNKQVWISKMPLTDCFSKRGRGKAKWECDADRRRDGVTCFHFEWKTWHWQLWNAQRQANSIISTLHTWCFWCAEEKACFNYSRKWGRGNWELIKGKGYMHFKQRLNVEVGAWKEYNGGSLWLSVDEQPAVVWRWIQSGGKKKKSQSLPLSSSPLRPNVHTNICEACTNKVSEVTARWWEKTKRDETYQKKQYSIN